MNWTCQNTADRMLDYLYQELNAEEKAACELHMKSCAHCAAELQGFQHVRSVSAQLPQAELSPAAMQRLLGEAQKASHIDQRAWWQKLWESIPVIASHPVLSGVTVAVLAVGLSVYVGKKENLSTSIQAAHEQVVEEPSSVAPSAPAPEVVGGAPYDANKYARKLEQKREREYAEKPKYDVSLPRKASQASYGAGSEEKRESNRSDDAGYMDPIVAAQGQLEALDQPEASAPASSAKIKGQYAEPPPSPMLKKSAKTTENRAALAADESELAADQLWERAGKAVREKRCNDAFRDFTKLLELSKDNLVTIKKTIGSCEPELAKSRDRFPELAVELIKE